MSHPVLVINGPNLNLLGSRDPEVYGLATLKDVESLCRETAGELGLEVEFFQSNHEGKLVDRIHLALTDERSIVANFGALTHTSIAIMDALAMLSTPLVEVHLSNIHAREPFRRHSYVSFVANAVVSGAGLHGYALALRHVAYLLGEQGRG